MMICRMLHLDGMGYVREVNNSTALTASGSKLFITLKGQSSPTYKPLSICQHEFLRKICNQSRFQVAIVEREKETMASNSWFRARAPFMAMITVECVEVGLTTLSKAAMKQGMSNFVFIVYYNALGTFLLLPVYLYNSFYRGRRVPLTFSLLYKFFLLGLIGICLLQICAYTGINYSSPTLAAAVGNLIPVFTFILAVVLRMEKLNLKDSSSQAKCLGTIVAISGAMVATLYTGPPILVAQTSSNSSYKFLSQSSNWALGGLLLAITCLFSSTTNILQAYTAKECPDEVVLVFFFSFFGTMLSAAFSVFLERDPNAWRLQHNIEIIAIVYAAVTTTVFRNTVVTWCLRERGPVYVVTYKPLAIIVAMIMGLIFLRDNLYLGSVIGSAAIAAGFYAVIWGEAREKYPAANDVGNLESASEQHAPLLKSTDDGVIRHGSSN